MDSEEAEHEHERWTPIKDDADWQAQGWSTDSVPMTAAPRLAATISIRLDPEDAALVQRAAHATGVTKSEFVRAATISAARRDIEQSDRMPIVVSALRVLGPDAAFTSGGVDYVDPTGRKAAAPNGARERSRKAG